MIQAESVPSSIFESSKNDQTYQERHAIKYTFNPSTPSSVSSVSGCGRMAGREGVTGPRFLDFKCRTEESVYSEVEGGTEMLQCGRGSL